jgi:hypothetical protein
VYFRAAAIVGLKCALAHGQNSVDDVTKTQDETPPDPVNILSVSNDPWGKHYCTHTSYQLYGFFASESMRKTNTC